MNTTPDAPRTRIYCVTKRIKFKAFLDHAATLGADKIATGHYARLDQDEQGRYRLLRGADESKDQSYFLHMLGQHQLAHACFPVGELLKSDLRAIALELNLQVHNKKDSTGICFIGERRFSEFLSEYVAPGPVPIITDRGDSIGTHNGIAFYTIGQRKGLGIGGNANYSTEPWYVIDKDTANNTLIVAQGHDHPRLHKRSLLASKVHWIREVPSDNFKCTAKVRYRQRDCGLYNPTTQRKPHNRGVCAKCASNHARAIGCILSGGRMPGRRYNRGPLHDEYHCSRSPAYTNYSDYRNLKGL